jgi:hypothetical protein
MTWEIAIWVALGFAGGVFVTSFVLRLVLRAALNGLREVRDRRAYLAGQEVVAMRLMRQANEAVIEAQDAAEEWRKERQKYVAARQERR